MVEPAVSRLGWRQVAFGDVVRKVADRVNAEDSGLERYVAGENMDTDDLRIRRWGIVGDGYLGPAFHMRFRPGQVLYGSRRTYLRKVAAPDFEGITANTTFVLEPNDPSVLLPELLPFIMQTESFHEHSIRQSKGSVNPYVNFSDLAWYKFALPPIDEQRRIAKALGAVDQLGESLRAGALAASKLRASVGRHLYWEGGPDSSVGPIGDVLSVGTGGTPSRGSADYWGGGIPWVKTAEVDFNVIVETEETISEKGLSESAAKLWPPYSVLIALYGQGPTRGRVAMLGVEAATNQACAAIVPNGDVDPWYVYYYLESRYEALRALAHGAAQPNLNLTMIKDFPIPIPSRSRQSEIVARSRDLAETEHALTDRLDRLQILRASLIAGALAQ